MAPDEPIPIAGVGVDDGSCEACRRVFIEIGMFRDRAGRTAAMLSSKRTNRDKRSPFRLKRASLSSAYRGCFILLIGTLDQP
jgi:hypothetical protein